MARFKYKGRDRRGKRQGTVSAGSRREAMMMLKEDGMRVIEMSEVSESILTKDISIGNPVKLQHFVIYLRQFATLIRAGITIVDATRILSEQTESKNLKKALLGIEQELRQGNPLSEAVARYSKIFSPMFINMVKAGEAGGNMDETLERLAEHFEKLHFTRQKIISALAYPLTVGVLAIGVVIFLLVNVVPTFVNMFSSMGSKLPAITTFVLSASSVMQVYWWLVVLGMAVIFAGFLFMRSNRKRKYYLDYMTLRMPIFGKMMQKAAIARMMRTMSSLFASSVPILQAMEIIEKIVENEVIAKVILEARDSLEKGRSMTEPMKQHWVFPPLVTQMIAIGEETGSLDEMLGKVADFYESEVEAATDRLKALIEPLMIVFLASLVGAIVAAILLPMFDFFTQFQNSY
ncbi:type II secretion system F family protein [Neobacillus sp. PS3-12]|jgi:type IV pilus assembly protein PilC|uniref:type II secretion system F family protein n=1 Tax=Neobacillus sp. PS3-12 TaxID=3070677 RepID=UPI0027E0F4A1|nr:type II secretion system F family protein [Neobacillus sp. PS3-12]WML54211.1 type II secretion system F family protein [Neobacillus sp. PS3-12]